MAGGAVDRITIVGASLAGLYAAEALRAEGFRGLLTLIGDEPYEPYDRPPLSKAVLAGWLPAEHTALPQDLEAEWLLGVPATGLDRAGHHVELADGRRVAFDRLLIATGTHARPWPNQEEGDLDGVFIIRGRDDAARLRVRLAEMPGRVLVIGGGFTGCEDGNHRVSVARYQGVQWIEAEVTRFYAHTLGRAGADKRPQQALLPAVA
jgi:NADPH-dependent 2,4-dienoyl-CoA reductase/sulfur reductase-like enzyme